MLNPFKEVNWSPDREGRKKFALSWIIGFPIIALIMFLIPGLIGETWSFRTPGMVAGIGAGLGALFWLVPQIALPFYRIWFAFGCTMGLIIGNLLLSLFFLLMITPIGLLRRVLGSPAILKKPVDGKTSYWEDARQPTDPARYYQQY